MPHIFEIDRVVVLVRRLGLKRVEVDFSELILDRIEVDGGDLFLCFSDILGFWQVHIFGVKFIDLLFDSLLEQLLLLECGLIVRLRQL